MIRATVIPCIVLGAILVLPTTPGVAEEHDSKKESGRDSWKTKVLAKYDRDGDGKLSEAERRAAHADWAKHRHHWKDLLEKRSEAWVAKFDRDHDGNLSKEERDAIRKKFIEKLEKLKEKWIAQYDKNQDGKLDKEERAVVRKKFARHLVVHFDDNDDNRLNADEVPRKHRQHFGKADTNKDGYVDADEVQAALAEAHEKIHELWEHRGKPDNHKKQQPDDGRQSLFDRIMAADANGDGKLNADEMPVQVRGGFGTADLNGDGYIDRDELRKRLEKRNE